tara:strand:- start:38 stop:751 length:714 start_codon:yes stop_codon:yes gene_type:complete
MSSTKIYYFGIDTPNDCLVKERLDEQYVHSKCPVVHHKNNRVFVAHSPVDFEAKVDRTPEGNFVTTNSKHLLKLPISDDYFSAPLPVLQLKSPMFLFYTRDDNVWFEFDAHPMTSLNNNFIAIGGWFNLSNWSRASSLAMTVVDETKPVIIKKGDPVCKIRFYPTDNLDNGVSLKEERDPKLISKIKSTYAKKQQIGWNDKNWKEKLFSKTEEKSKCPVSFLFKKKKTNIDLVKGFK